MITDRTRKYQLLMADAPDSLDPKEATEARLCAYLEGELAPAERVEIEKHLKVNPQHRQLLIDLAQTRDWMRTIPRETAPSDLAETFAAQVERSMLLDPQSDPTSTISRLPQYMLLAAIVMLTLGLGVLIMVMLNGGKSYTLRPTVSVGGLTTQPLKSASTAPVDSVAASGTAAKTGPVQSITTALPAAATPAVSESARQAIAINASPTAMSADAASAQGNLGGRNAPQAGAFILSAGDRIEREKVQTLLKDRQLPVGRKAVCLVVETATPAATAEQVRRFFTGNQLAFLDNRSPPTATAPLAAATSSAETGPLANASPIVNAGKEDSLQKAAGGAGQMVQQNAQNQARAFPGENLYLPQPPAARNNLSRAAQTTQPSLLSNNKSAEDTTDQLMYVGRDLTPLQVELLHGTLVTGGIRQAVQRFDLTQPATTQIADEPPAPPSGPVAITKGQTLTVTVPQLVGPGTEKTNFVKVADDGTINLPMLDPVPAAGMSPAALQDRIAGRYREANLIPAATVSVAVVTPAATQPTSQPTASFAFKTSATQPSSTQPVVAAKPATRPVDDGKVDVVVVLHKSN